MRSREGHVPCQDGASIRPGIPFRPFVARQQLVKLLEKFFELARRDMNNAARVMNLAFPFLFPLMLELGKHQTIQVSSKIDPVNLVDQCAHLRRLLLSWGKPELYTCRAPPAIPAVRSLKHLFDEAVLRHLLQVEIGVLDALAEHTGERAG